MTTEPQGIVAMLPPGDPRGAMWTRLFTTTRVPVKNDTPQLTAFPDGTEKLCYFVDFDSCAWLKPRLIECCRRMGSNPVIMAMLNEDIYPIIAHNLTVVRGPRRMFQQAE